MSSDEGDTNAPPPSTTTTTTTTTTSNWADLTKECLLNILSRLTISDIWAGAMLVCKPWLHACKDSSVHTRFDFESFFKDDNTESIHTWSTEFERRVDAMLCTVVDWSNGGLTEIRVRHCSDFGLTYAAERCPNLQVLSIKSCQNVTDLSMASVASHCRNLQELDISYCYKISQEGLVLIGNGCPVLEVLKRNYLNWLDTSEHVGLVPTEYLNACPRDGDSEAAAIAKNMPQLEKLELRFSKLTLKGLVSLSNGCFNLESLDLTGCANLSDRDLQPVIFNFKSLIKVEMPNFFAPTGRYGHWNLYDERFRYDGFGGM